MLNIAWLRYSQINAKYCKNINNNAYNMKKMFCINVMSHMSHLEQFPMFGKANFVVLQPNNQHTNGDQRDQIVDYLQ